jgi:rod shape-determining protein MreD
MCGLPTSGWTASWTGKRRRNDMNLVFWQRIDLAARNVTPFAISVVLVLLSVLPIPAPGLNTITPAFAIMSLYHWAIYRPNLMPFSAVFAIGLLQDLLTGAPVGLFTLVFLTTYGVAVTQRRFIAGKSFLIYWLGFVMLALAAAFESWVLASIWYFTVLDPRPVLFQLLVSVGIFPLLAWMLLQWQQTVLGDLS